jgi:hypothetical protein
MKSFFLLLHLLHPREENSPESISKYPRESSFTADTCLAFSSQLFWLSLARKKISVSSSWWMQTENKSRESIGDLFICGLVWLVLGRLAGMSHITLSRQLIDGPPLHYLKCRTRRSLSDDVPRTMEKWLNEPLSWPIKQFSNPRSSSQTSQSQ